MFQRNIPPPSSGKKTFCLHCHNPLGHNLKHLCCENLKSDHRHCFTVLWHEFTSHRNVKSSHFSPFTKMSSLITFTRCTAPSSPMSVLWLRVTLRRPGRESRSGSQPRRVCFQLSLYRWIFWYCKEQVISTTVVTLYFL